MLCVSAYFDSNHKPSPFQLHPKTTIWFALSFPYEGTMSGNRFINFSYVRIKHCKRNCLGGVINKNLNLKGIFIILFCFPAHCFHLTDYRIITEKEYAGNYRSRGRSQFYDFGGNDGFPVCCSFMNLNQ